MDLLYSNLSIQHSAFSRVNNAILSSVPLSSASSENWSCWFCSCLIEFIAKQVKSQSLTCRQCLRMFHKKCTDRSRARGGNWNREPWLCTTCTASGVQSSNQPVATNSSVTQPQVRRDQPLLTHVQPPANAALALTETLRPSLQQEDISIVDINPPIYIPPDILNPSAIYFHPKVPLFTPTMDAADPAPELFPQVPINSAVQPTISTRRFPSNAIRQRGSNVAVMHPE